MIGEDEALHAEVELRHCTAELWLNGFPLRRKKHPGDPFASIPVHQYVIAGENRLELVIEPGDRPSESRMGDRTAALVGARAIARLVRYPALAFADAEEGTVLGEVQWVAPTDRSETFPLVRSGSFVVPAPFGRFAFQDAPVLALDAATHAECVTLLGALREAFVRGEAARVRALLDLRFQEGLRAYPANEPALLDREMADYVAEVASPDFEVLPLDGAQHDFRLVAQGRAIELVDRDFQPSLRFRGPDDEGDEITGFALTVARVGGRLVVIR